MPRQLYKIDQFHGGLNTQANASDIQDNEFVELEDAMVDELGRIKMMGSVTTGLETADNTGITGTMKAGYGIHTFKSDYTGAEDKGSNELPTGDEYVAMYDGHDGHVWLYSTEEEDWDDDVNLSAGNGIIDIGNSTTASVKPTFYSMEGGLRVSDGNHSLNNNSKWYGYIKRTLFQSITSTVESDGWFDYDQYVSAPSDTSQWDGTISTYGTTPGSNYSPSLSAATTQFITADDLFDNSVLNFNVSIEVTVRITTATITGIPGETDFDTDFLFKSW